MIIEFTIEQAEELFNPFWDVDYEVTLDDGTVITTSTEQDTIREFPIPLIHHDIANLGQRMDSDGVLIGYACAHPQLTVDDEIVIKAILDERVAFTNSVKAAPQANRAGMRQAKRVELRTEARQDTRREARRKQRIADREAAREAYRAEMRERYADAIAAGITVVLERPNVDDLKAAWVDYAEQEGIDTAGMTKQEIIDAVDAL